MFTKNNLQSQTTCTACDGALIFDVHTDERICNKCGIVMPACDEFLHNDQSFTVVGSVLSRSQDIDSYSDYSIVSGA